MKVTSKVVGSGFTARVVTTYSDFETPAELKAAFDDLPERGGRHPFLDFLDTLEADARKYLRRRGLPHELGVYWKKGGEWVKAALPLQRGVRYCNLHVVIREAGYAHDTGPGYAEKMLRLIAGLKAADNADPESLDRAFDLGDLVRESKIKFLRRRQARPGGNSRGKNNAARNEWMAREFNTRRPSSRVGVKDLAERISAEWARKNKAKALRKSAAYEAVLRGNKILSGEHRKPDR